MPLPLLYSYSSVSDAERRSLLEQGEERAKRMFAGFIDFAFSGNILEIAFGLMLVIYFSSCENTSQFFYLFFFVFLLSVFISPVSRSK